MKLFIFLSVFFVIAIAPFYCVAQWSFSAAGNLHLSRENISIDQSAIAVTPFVVKSKYILLPDMSIHVDYQLNRVFLLRSGIIFDGKGGYYTNPENTTIFHRNYVYLDVPLFIIANPDLFHCNHFYAGLGPFIGYGLGGWFKNEDANTREILAKGTIKFGGKGRDYLNRFDNGIGFLLGYRVANRWRIHVIYQYGLTNIYKGPSSCYSRGLSFGMNYKIR